MLTIVKQYKARLKQLEVGETEIYEGEKKAVKMILTEYRKQSGYTKIGKPVKTKEQKLDEYKRRVLSKFDQLEDRVAKLEYLNNLIERNNDEDKVEMLIGLVNDYKSWGY